MASRMAPAVSLIPPSRTATLTDFGMTPSQDMNRRDSSLSVTSEEGFESLVQPGASLPRQAEDLPGKLIAERWSAVGGYAEVHQGIWERPDGTRVPVAIKKLTPSHMSKLKFDHEAQAERNLKRMRRETTIWMQTSHPNILPLLGFRQEDFCLVSPWCQHGNLEDYIKQNPDLPSIQRLQLLRQAAEGLNYLHTRDPPICHADMKPSNILVQDNLEAAIGDFGLSRVVSTLVEHNLYITSGVGQGGVGYQALEILDAQPPSMEADVFGFGGVLLMVMSGKAPYHKCKTHGQVIGQMFQGILPKPSDHPDLPVGHPMWDTISKCWANKPTDRPTVLQIIADINAQIAAVS